MTQINLRKRLKVRKSSLLNKEDAVKTSKTSSLEENIKSQPENLSNNENILNEEPTNNGKDTPKQSTDILKYEEYEAKPLYDFEELKDTKKKPNLFKDVNKRMLLIATVIASIAALLAINYIQSNYSSIESMTRPIKVVVAAREIPARTVITPEMLKTMEIPAMYVVGGALKPTDSIVGKVATTTIFANEQIHRLRISAPNATTGIAPNIPAGHRSMKITTTDTSGIKPTDYVDIIVSLPDPSNPNKIITTPAIQKALVLAVGDQVSPSDPDTLRNNQLTIAIPENRVNLMVLLKNKGNFTIVSRAPGDESILQENFTTKEIENALLGQLVNAPTTKPVTKPVEQSQPTTKLVDTVPNYTPVYNRAPVYRAPAYKPPAYTPPKKVQQPQAPAVKPPIVWNLSAPGNQKK